jgi:hypothetical protein
MPYRPARFSIFAAALLWMSAVACTDPSPTATATPGAALSLDRAGEQPGTHRQYGTPIKLGNGRARSYVVLNMGVPLEVGVALDATALEGLRAPMPPMDDMPEGGDHVHVDFDPYLLPMPAQNPTPYKFIELDWNPAGHEPANIYTLPHFDFHFYKIDVAARNAILPTDPAFEAKSANVPAAEFMPPFAFSPPPLIAVPQMGVHWVDVRSPELQPPPNNKTFTTTFINGTYNGAVIFQEPMITREFILSKPNVTIPIPVAARMTPSGYYPSAYSITFDEQAKEHRIALTQLGWRN